MAVWLVRAGSRGEHEETALENNVAIIGWTELHDLSSVPSQKDLQVLCEKKYPDAKPKTISQWAGQIWTFIKRIQRGDLVCLPLKGRSAIAFGEVLNGYRYRPDLPKDARHTRQVRWLRTDVPRSAFDQDILLYLELREFQNQVLEYM